MIDHAIAYWDDPEKVIWIDLGHRRLQGFDNMWVAGDCYGMFNDPENFDIYEGLQEVAWCWDGTTETVRDEILPLPLEALVWRGWMLTTEQAEFVGLL